jgi:hypothetical protein
VARICRPSCGGRLGDGGRHVDLGVVGLGQQQRDDDDLVVPALTSRSTTVVNDGLDSSRNAARSQVGAHGADLVDQGLDRGGGAGVTAAVSQGHQCRSSHQVRPPSGVGAVSEGDALSWGGAWQERGSGHEWIPHSVLLVPAQRPLRGSSPGATRRVHGQQPIDG